MLKVFCRIYQFAATGLMALLPWKMPETVEGSGSVRRLPELIREKGFEKVLVVTDRGLMSLHLLDGLFQALEEQKIAYAVYDAVEPNPTEINVEQGVSLYKKNQCQAIIAFGGGSPMDCAKGVAARIARPNKTVVQMQGLFKVLKQTPVIFAVPTTAGTGSETTVAAVITESATHHKASMNDLPLMPKYAVLDPELTVGLPPKVTSTTGMDALCHAVEAYTNHKYNSALENDLSKKAVKLVYDNLYTAYCDGSNLEARHNMQLAAFYAGRAFTRGCVGYVHAIGHTLGGLYGTPHGLAMSILLPHVMRRFGKAAWKRLAELCDVCGIPAKGNTEQAKAEAFIGWIEDLKRKMDIPEYPTMIKKGDLPQIVTWACAEANPLYPTPVCWNKKDMRAFLESMLQREPT